MESWIVRKKRTFRSRTPKSFFNKLPLELQSNIFCRLSLEEQSNSMCVSHQWRNMIINTTLPKEPPLLPFVVPHNFLPNPYRELQNIFHWCSLVMHCETRPKKLLDTCNGLYLFCHNNGRALNITRDVYYYYVINPKTEQCVAVPKAKGQKSGSYSYAALAYDPKESRFFKIVRFQGHRHINIFSSMTGLWTTLNINLPQHINKSKWVQKSIYIKGSLYRLFRSGYLVKIKVDPQENPLKQTELISLHSDCLLDGCRWEISSKDDKLMLVLCRGLNFWLFELIESVTNNSTCYTWDMIFHIENEEFLPLNTYGEFLSYHPYHDLVFFKRGYHVYFYLDEFTGNYYTNFGTVEYNKTVYDYIRNCGQPLLDCSVPFACILDKKVINCTYFILF